MSRLNRSKDTLRDKILHVLSGAPIPMDVENVRIKSGLKNWETGWDEPTRKLQGVKKLKKIIGNKKGIDTILAALLMVVIVVVASVMVYAWSTGLLGTLLVTPQTGKEAMNIENSAFNSNVN